MKKKIIEEVNFTIPLDLFIKLRDFANRAGVKDYRDVIRVLIALELNRTKQQQKKRSPKR